MWTMKRKAAFSPFNIYWSGVPSAVRKPMLLRRTGGGTRTLHGSCESCQESLNLFSLKCGKTLSQWFVDMRHKPRRHTDTSDTQRMQMQRRSWKRLWLGPSWQLHISVIQRSRGFWRWEKYGKVMESMDETDEFLFHGPRSRAALPGPSPLWERRRCLGAKIGVVTMRMTLSVVLTPWSQPVAAQLVPLSACHDVYAKGSWQLFLCESWWWWRPQRCLVILLQKIHWNILKHIETYWNILKHIETLSGYFDAILVLVVMRTQRGAFAGAGHEGKCWNGAELWGAEGAFLPTSWHVNLWGSTKLLRISWQLRHLRAPGRSWKATLLRTSSGPFGGNQEDC